MAASARVRPLQRLLTGPVRRAGWGFLDQALSSVSNFALSAFVAATVSATEVGSFTIAYAVYGVWAGVSGGLTSIPLTIRYSAAPPEQSRRATRAAVGAALVIGTVGGLFCL